MSYTAKVTVSPTGQEDRFQVTWYDVEAESEDSFEQPAGEITAREVESSWEHPAHQTGVGELLFRFLDGDARHLKRALDKAGRRGGALRLHLLTCPAAADWPFELLARKGEFLLQRRIHLIRYVSDWGIDNPVSPEDRPMRLLFMASSAIDVEPELNFEKEEESIFQVTEKLAVEMEVEDSGSLTGLKGKLEQQQYDVVHLSGHAGIKRAGASHSKEGISKSAGPGEATYPYRKHLHHGREKETPFFIMENETGHRDDVFPNRLWDKALIENPPRLLFLSGCRTGQTPDPKAAISFARHMVEKHHVPAVLGWGRPVSDQQATQAEKMIYHELSRGKSILEAVQRARYELAQKFADSPGHAWPLLRLFAGGMSIGGMVKKGQPRRPQLRRMTHTYLGPVKVLEQGFVGRRRQLQMSLQALRRNFDKTGVLLLGSGGSGKSCLAGKICERFTDHKLVVVQGKLDNVSLKSALTDAFVAAQDEKGREILDRKGEMEDRLADLCATSFKENNYLLLLDDFEFNLEGAQAGQPGLLTPQAAGLLEALLHFLPLGGKMTQIIITSRYSFSLTQRGRDLIQEKLQPVYLTGFREPEQRKKERELENILQYSYRFPNLRLAAEGRGNPLLMERLDEMLGKVGTVEKMDLSAAIVGEQEKFIAEQVLEELLASGGAALKRLLSWMSVFRLFVSREGVELIAEQAGVKSWRELLEQGLRLSLIEYDQARRAYRGTPLLQERLLAGLKEEPHACHEAALLYYKHKSASKASVYVVNAEEMTYHYLESEKYDDALKSGGMLVKHHREHLALDESKRVGLWVLEELDKKKRELSTAPDTFLLNETALTMKETGDYAAASEYLDKALAVDRSLHGDKHADVGRDLHNLCLIRSIEGDHRNAIELYEQALDNIGASPGKSRDVEIRGVGSRDGGAGEDGPPLNIVGTVLHNLGAAWSALGEPEKGIEYYEKVLESWKKIYGEKHTRIAHILSSLAAAWDDLGETEKARSHFEQALSIYGASQKGADPGEAVVLQNLGALCFGRKEYRKAVEYYEQALTLCKKIYGEEHPVVADVTRNLKAAREALTK